MHEEDANDIPRYFRRQPRMRYHFSDDLRMAVVGGDDEALMRMGAHLQACPDCQARQVSLVEALSVLATSNARPEAVTRASTTTVEPAPAGIDAPQRTESDEPYVGACALTRSAYFRFLEQDRALSTEFLYHLMTCDDCRTQLTDAAFTRYTIEMHGEEELPAIG